MDWHGIVSKAIEAFRDTSGLESYAMDAAAKAASKEYERQRAEFVAAYLDVVCERIQEVKANQ